MEQLFAQVFEAIQAVVVLALLIGFIAFKLAGLVVGLLVKFFAKGGEIAFAYFSFKFAEVSHSLRARQAQFLIAWRK